MHFLFLPSHHLCFSFLSALFFLLPLRLDADLRYFSSSLVDKILVFFLDYRSWTTMMTTSLQVRNKFPLAVRLGWFTVVLLDVSSGGSLRQFSGLVDLDLVLHSNESLFSTTVVSQTTRLVRWLCRLDQIGLGRDNVVAGTCR